MIRNINLLLNVAPDKEGVIPQNQQEVLLKTGDWLSKEGKGIYGTRGGPWYLTGKKIKIKQLLLVGLMIH